MRMKKKMTIENHFVIFVKNLKFKCVTINNVLFSKLLKVARKKKKNEKVPTCEEKILDQTKTIFI